VVDLGQRLVGVGHGDHRHRLQPVAQAGEDLGGVAVERPGEDLAHLRAGGRAGEEPVRGVEHGDVDADLVEAPVQEVGHHARRPVEGVARRHRPPTGA
jgi:hypothetical protein